MTVMNIIHLSGVSFILWMQNNFKGHEELMLYLSHAGDPRNAFLIYFPLAYFCHRSTGVKVMWAGILSEWLNAVLKWMMFGERPYWWAQTSSLYEEPPRMNQYRLTCETGPGSPSGHSMVTASVLSVLIQSLLTHRLNTSKHSHQMWSAMLWTGFILVMSLVSLSRCFIAAHFPHQVIAGTIVGAVLGKLIMGADTDSVPLRVYTMSSVVILLTGPAIYWLVELLGYDPMWTVALATRWCARPDWVYLDTTLFYAITRDASVLLGTGLGLALVEKKFDPAPVEGVNKHAVLQIVVSILFTRGMEYVKVPQDNRTVFYAFSYLKYMCVFFVVVVFVAKLGSRIFPKNQSEKKS